MLILMVVAIVLIAIVHEAVITNFKTNIPLNGLIFFVIIIACFKAFKNNYTLRKMALFVNVIDRVEDTDITEADTEQLSKRLKSQYGLLDMHNMQVAIGKMHEHGRFTLNDKDAMLIKSKLGGRVRGERNVVAYFAGILVMLGLIGTFWGLLLTIAAVGDAMGEVTKSMMQTEGAETDAMANMAEFIGSISAPLQGMGVAFSSSLFGLTGSLFLSVLNFFGGHAQNRFMEDMARWLDLHIPSMNPALAKKTKEMKKWMGKILSAKFIPLIITAPLGSLIAKGRLKTKAKVKLQKL